MFATKYVYVEYDNFEIDQVINNVNTMLRDKMNREVRKEEVVQKLSNSSIGLMKALSDVVWRENQKKFTDIISKVELAHRLIEPRTIEIRKERDFDGWKPVLPIEQQLNKIFSLVPRFIG